MTVAKLTKGEVPNSARMNAKAHEVTAWSYFSIASALALNAL